ncbi:cupin domain-containing protein [Solimicrobium silvestre]|uniref:Cupin domain n=1 Tax=Solimicrobium silvestre TaxID=2099400 RepID=A0A2S9H2W8_9BURK|nr:cupin domain-containing protein [Solimicrobium silvestre]PRC94206.1 Cupin domain [Solimicrobium silvestre]
MNLTDWNTALDTCIYDSTVGIKIAKLAGDAFLSTYLTSIDPGKSVNAHYHKKGNEHYHIIQGSGEMTLVDVGSKALTKVDVYHHQSFVVQENTLHQLKNTGNTKLVLMFSCPESHLNEDRFLL